MLDTPSLIKNKVMSILKNLGIVYVEVRYSGGNDSGDVNIIARRADGPEEEITNHSTYSFNGPPKQLTLEQEEENILFKLLSDPVYEEWFSFAGAFYVDGVYIWDVLNDKVTKEQQVETPSWESESDEW